MTGNIKICSMNVRGLADHKKRFDLFSWLKQKKFSIYCIQDTHSNLWNEQAFRQDWGSDIIFNYFSSEARVAVMFSSNLDYKIKNVTRDKFGNLLIIDLKMNDLNLTLVVIYGPNKDEPLFYDNIKNILFENENNPVIMCGDWNLVLNFEKDTLGYIRENNIKAREKVEEIIRVFELTDTWRSQYPDLKRYTWTSAKKPIQMSRLDFFLVTADIHAKVIKHFITHRYRSDHSFIGIEIDLTEITRGRGFWKFNTMLLQDEMYIKMVKKEIENTISDYSVKSKALNDHNPLSVSKQMLFEIMKLRIRGITIPYCAKKKREMSRDEASLEKHIQDLEIKISNLDIASNVDRENLFTNIAKCKEDLKILRQPKIKGMMLRSKAQIYELTDKPTNYFCNLEKRNYINKLITRVNVGDRMVTDQKSILQQLTKFYSDLYKSKCYSNSNNYINEFLIAENIRVLNDDNKLACEGLITDSEIKNVLKNMKNGKSPGTDGYPCEFYKFFWRDLGSFLLDSINESFLVGELSITQKQAIVSLLPKGNKPREFIKNWRPISLLNVDYKLLSGVLAKRLKSVLPSIISSEQKGFLKTRYIGENIRTVYDLIHYLEKQNMTGLLLLVDFEKAFDSIEWNYVNKLLDMYNFGPHFKKWFNILYKDSCSCVINNGYFSEFFTLSRSFRQGDPLSPYLFILAIEPLAMAIKNNKKIKGIQVENSTIKIGQYADDTFLTLDGSELSLRESINVFNMFHKCSGLKVNIEKTMAIWLGNQENTIEGVCEDLNLHWVEKFELLGIKFSLNLKEMIDLNYTIKINNIEKLLNGYRKMRLSLIGRITVIKTLAIPQLVYLMTVLPSPGKYIFSKLEDMFKHFIWDGNVKIVLNQLEKDVAQGGLRLTNLQCFHYALKLSWIKRLVQTKGNWQSLFDHTISHNRKQIWELDTDSLIYWSKYKIGNVFWKEIFEYWAKYKSFFNHEIDARSYPIWDTHFLQIPNLRYMRNQLMDRGIIYFNDLLRQDGNLFGYQEFLAYYNITLNFVDFYSLFHCIPRTWKLDYNKRLNGTEVQQNVLDRLLKMNKICKVTYLKFLDNVQIYRSHITKWQTILQEEIDNEMWQAFYSVNFACTIESKMRAFQYRILMRIIPTNKYLKLVGIKESDKCYFCEIQEETIEHLFWYCPKIQKFWEDIAQCLDPFIGLRNVLNAKTVLLGYIDKYKNKIINHIINIIKRTIYITKCSESSLSTERTCNIIKYYYSLEKNIVEYSRCGNMTIFEKKWSHLSNFVN